MANEDMPFYQQLPESCGLASLLMALKPVSRKIDLLLNYGWEKIGPMFETTPNETQELRWQRVLEFLLTACTQHPVLRSFLEKEYPHFPESVRPWLEYALLGEPARADSVPRPDLLRATHLIMRRVHTMKHDVELKLLGFLFGCRFIPWEEDLEGTGAVFLNHEELQEKRKGQLVKSVERKLEFIKKGIDNGGPVLWGAVYHWLAARDIHLEGGNQVLFYHDPMGSGDHLIEVTALRETDRFYVFTFDPKLLEEHQDLVKQAFDIPEPIPETPPKVTSEEIIDDDSLEAQLAANLVESAEKFDEEAILDEELLKVEIFAQRIKALQAIITEKDRQLAEKNKLLKVLKVTLAEQKRLNSELKKKLGSHPSQ